MRGGAGWCYGGGMKLPCCLLLMMVSRLPVSGQMRTFASVKGGEIRAEITGCTDTVAELRREDGKRFTVPLATLSEADRTWIAEWRKTHKPYRVQVVPSQKKGNTREVKEAITGTVKGNDCWYALGVKNAGVQPVTGLRLEYIVYPPGNSGVVPQPGSVEVAEIAPGKTGQAATAKCFVPQSREVIRSGLNDAVRLTESGLAGLHLELWIDGKPAGVMKSGTVPEDAAAALAAWREKQTAPAALPEGKVPEKMIEKTR